jgi:Kef-type K+ transport system membrane component KefB
VIATVASLAASIGLPPPAGSTGLDASGAPLDALFAVFVLFVGAKIGEEVARRLRQPAVVGELLGGFVVGTYGLGWVTPDQTALVLAEIGVVILLFSVGLEVRMDDLLAVGRPAVVTAFFGMLLPILAAVAFGLAIDASVSTALFIGLALAATSIGITSRVLAEMGVLDRTFARIILGAAVIDDVASLILIGLVAGAVTGDLSASTILVSVAAVGLVGLGFAAARHARGLRREAFTWPMFADTPLVPAFILMFTLALVSAAIGLAAIIGAFVAGLIVAETEAREELEHEMRSLGQIFIPFFFAVTGAQLDLGALLDPSIAGLAIVLAVIGILTKLLGGIVGAWPVGRWSAVAVGAGMVPRGEVGIVVVNLGLVAGVLTGATFSAVLVAVVVTTVVAPYLLSFAVPRALPEDPPATAPTAA